MDTVKFVNTRRKTSHLDSGVNLGFVALICELRLRHQREFKCRENRIKILVADGAVANEE